MALILTLDVGSGFSESDWLRRGRFVAAIYASCYLRDPGSYSIPFATLLFMVQDPIQRWLIQGAAPDAHNSPRWLIGTGLFQFGVAVYGGYFGAGIGILMLALIILGLTDIHQMNGLKNFFALCINGVAALYFIWADMVNWSFGLLMAAAAIGGGYGSAGLARKVGRQAVRYVIVFIGFSIAASLLVKQFIR